MSFNEIFSALKEQTALCAKFLEIVTAETDNSISPDACITTFLTDPPHGNIQSIPFSRLHVHSDAMDIIKYSTDVKEVTQEIKDTHTGKSGVISGTFQEYFREKISPLKEAERKFVIENNYSIEGGRYFAIPFPPESELLGVFFLFARNEEEFLILSNLLNKISDKVGKVFLNQ